jgi:large subunit ribosomal protein L18
MDPSKKKQQLRRRRHQHVRKDLGGTSERPRLCVFRSNKHIYCQVIDDWEGKTLASASTNQADLREATEGTSRTERAAKVGALVAERCLEAGIKQVVFDRGGYKYHGCVKAVAEAAREKFKEAGAVGF